MKKRRGQNIPGILVVLIIAVVVLVLMLIFYGILTGKGTDALTYLKNIFRFRLK